MATVVEFLLDYALFFAKTATLVVAVALLFGIIFGSVSKLRQTRLPGYIEVHKINSVLENYKSTLQEAMLLPAEFKQYMKGLAKAKSGKKSKVPEKESRKRLFYIKFKGNVTASAVNGLRHEVSTILTGASEQDEVLISVESPGGTVSGYGFAASQLQRIRDKGIHLTVAVDKVAASGGYLMACIANKIIAAPFAIIGSIGVVAQVPNFHKLLKKNDVDVDIFTAGEFKRTVTVFGENTAAGKEKFQEELDSVHKQFKEAVEKYRQDVDIAQVATGETWLAQQAKDIGLVDELMTSDAHLMDAAEDTDIFQIKWVPRISAGERLMSSIGLGVGKWLEVLTHTPRP